MAEEQASQERSEEPTGKRLENRERKAKLLDHENLIPFLLLSAVSRFCFGTAAR